MKIRHLILLVIPVVLAFVVIHMAQRTVFGIVMLQHSAPFLLPSSQLARNLESTDIDLVRESLALLRERRDPLAAHRVGSRTAYCPTTAHAPAAAGRVATEVVSVQRIQRSPTGAQSNSPLSILPKGRPMQ